MQENKIVPDIKLS